MIMKIAKVLATLVGLMLVYPMVIVQGSMSGHTQLKVTKIVLSYSPVHALVVQGRSHQNLSGQVDLPIFQGRLIRTRAQ